MNVAVTAVLGLVLLLTWMRGAGKPLRRLVGICPLAPGGRVAATAMASPVNAGQLVAIGTVAIILGDALK